MHSTKLWNFPWYVWTWSEGWRNCSNFLRISGTGLKFGGVMHSTMNQITIWNGLKFGGMMQCTVKRITIWNLCPRPINVPISWSQPAEVAVVLLKRLVENCSFGKFSSTKWVIVYALGGGKLFHWTAVVIALSCLQSGLWCWWHVLRSQLPGILHWNKGQHDGFYHPWMCWRLSIWQPSTPSMMLKQLSWLVNFSLTS